MPGPAILKAKGEHVMARPASQALTENELAIMRVLWEDCPLSVNEILKRIPKKPKPAYNSLLTLVGILEKKGHVAHKKEGKAFLYSPVLKDTAYRQFEVKHLVRRLFDGNAIDLAVNLVKSKSLTPVEREELKKILEDL
jgi:BlaI family penicillinase repressor